LTKAAQESGAAIGDPGTSLSIASLAVLATTTLPVEVEGSASDGWMTLLHNVARPQTASGRDLAAGTEWLTRLNERKASLFLPEYDRRYSTALLTALQVHLQQSANTTDVPASLLAFVSLVRSRFICVSVWLSIEDTPPNTDSTALASVLNDRSATVIAREPAELLPDHLFGHGTTPPVLAGLDLPAAFVEVAITAFGGHIRARGGTASPHPGARFDATVATLRDPPTGFGAPSSPGAIDGSDWRCRAAELLPTVRGNAARYHPSYLIDALGTDVMDTSAGHYFLGRRRVLGLLGEADAPVRSRIHTNTVTWTHLLCENASVQLAAIRDHAGLLQQRTETLERSPSRATRSFTRAQLALYQDFDEAQNIAVSLDPVFWSHQETLKTVSGLSGLASNLLQRSQVITSTSAVQEQSAFAAAAQALTVVAGALTLVTSTIQVAIYAEVATRTVAILAAASAALGALLGVGLIQLIARRRQR